MVVISANPTENNSNFVLARYNTDGTLDSTFSEDGKQTTGFTSDFSSAQSIMIQTDGKIVVAGYTGINYPFPFAGLLNSDFAIARYKTDGSLDSSFSGDGKQTIDFATGNDLANAVALQNDGSIVIAGTSNGHFAIVRIVATGKVDKTLATMDNKSQRQAMRTTSLTV